MAGFVIERHGYTSAALMVADIATDMVANGFKLSFQTSGEPSLNKASLTAPYRLILEAGGDVDPLNASGVSEKQPWRICFDVQAAETVFVHAGTPVQLPDTGVIAVMKKLTTYTQGNGQQTDTVKAMVPYDVVGSIGAEMSDGTRPSTRGGSTGSGQAGYLVASQINDTGIYTPPTWIRATGQSSDQPLDAGFVDEETKGFVNRSRRVTTLGASYPLSYRLVISPRGMWLGCWEEAATQETSSNFNWILIQRPVDRATGQVLTTGKAPVMCLNCVGGLYWQFTVREQDIFRPGKRRQADADLEDSECIINSANQVSLSEDGKYIVTFPSRLNTSRYRYPHELDMIGTTSADVVSQYSDVPLTVYGESSARTYKALQANGQSNTGMRLLVLLQGGGIS